MKSYIEFINESNKKTPKSTKTDFINENVKFDINTFEPSEIASFIFEYINDEPNEFVKVDMGINLYNKADYPKIDFDNYNKNLDFYEDKHKKHDNDLYWKIFEFSSIINKIKYDFKVQISFKEFYQDKTYGYQTNFRGIEEINMKLNFEGLN